MEITHSDFPILDDFKFARMGKHNLAIPASLVLMSRVSVLFASGAFALEFAIELTLGLAELAREALEGFFFVEVRFGLEAGHLC